MPRASAPAASAKIGTITATADANASVICMPSLFCAPGNRTNPPPPPGQVRVAAARFSRAVRVSG